jgi:hypothetical protein
MHPQVASTNRTSAKCALLIATLLAAMSVVDVSSASSGVLDAAQCERLLLISLPAKGTAAVPAGSIQDLHKNLRTARFNGEVSIGRALSIPTALSEITPTACVNFGRLCPVVFVAWLLHNPASSSLLGGDAVVDAWHTSLQEVIASDTTEHSLVGEEDADDMVADAVKPTASLPTVIPLKEMVSCVLDHSSSVAQSDPSGGKEEGPDDVVLLDLHESTQRDKLLESIRNIRTRVEMLTAAASREGGDVLGASPPATVARLLPSRYLHRWSDMLSLYGQYKDVVIVPVVLGAVCSWVIVWVCYGGSRSLWAWVDTHRRSKEEGDYANMVATATRWHRLNLLGAVHRAHVVSSALPLVYCCFIGWYLTAVLGIGSLISVLLSPSATPLIIIAMTGGGVTVFGGGFLVLLVQDAMGAMGQHRRLQESFEATD